MLGWFIAADTVNSILSFLFKKRPVRPLHVKMPAHRDTMSWLIATTRYKFIVATMLLAFFNLTLLATALPLGVIASVITTIVVFKAALYR